MKKNEFVIIKGLSLKELKMKAKDLKKEIANLSMDKNMKKLKDLKSISKKRKDLAQVLTVLNAKQLLEKLTPKVDSDDKKVLVDKPIKKPQVKKKGKTKTV